MPAAVVEAQAENFARNPGIANKHVSINGLRQVAILSLGLTKTGKRVGAAESLTLSVIPLLHLLWRWKRRTKPGHLLAPSPYQWRGKFSRALQELKVDHPGFRPYSLTRGGATMWFQRRNSFDKLLQQGRWSSTKTARLYLNEGLATLAETKLPQSSLQPFLRVFHQTVPQ